MQAIQLIHDSSRSTWLETAPGQWIQLTPGVLRELAGRYPVLSEEEIAGQHGPVRRRVTFEGARLITCRECREPFTTTSGGTPQACPSCRIKAQSPAPVSRQLRCRRCQHWFTRTGHGTPAWCQECWQLIPPCLRCGNQVTGHYARQWLRGKAGDKLLCADCVTAVTRQEQAVKEPGSNGNRLPAGQPAGTADMYGAEQLGHGTVEADFGSLVRWLGTHPDASTAQVAYVLGVGSGRASLILEAARKAGFVSRAGGVPALWHRRPDRAAKDGRRPRLAAVYGDEPLRYGSIPETRAGVTGWLRAHPEATTSQVAWVIGVSRVRAETILRAVCDAGSACRVVRDRHALWSLVQGPQQEPDKDV